MTQRNDFEMSSSTQTSGRLRSVVERLEHRRLFSGIAAASLGGIGAMGDSYPDEYQFYAPDRSTARNFIEQLAEDRGLNFGQFNTSPLAEPRNAGFSYNWARSGDTSDDLIAHGQHTGLAAQVAAGEVKNVFLFIGGNDLRGVFSSADPVAAVQAVVPNVLTNINTAIQTVLAADPNVRIVIATVPGVGILPEAKGAVAAGILPQALVDAVDQAAAALNDQVRLMAAQSDQIAVADVAGLVQQVFSKKRPHLGRVKLDRDQPSNDPSHLFLADGIHAGTIGQGLLANVFVKAMKSEFGVRIKQLRPREIIENAFANLS